MGINSISVDNIPPPWHPQVPADQGQTISITPARTRVIFEADHFLDGGTLQFYGQAQECVVTKLVGERITGLVAWGQWRGWYTPPCGSMGMPPCPTGALDARSRNATSESSASEVSAATRHMLGGEMGNGVMMNTQLRYLSNHITVGNHIVRWTAADSQGQRSVGFGKFYNGASFNIQAVNIEPDSKATCDKPGEKCRDWRGIAATAAVVFRGNTGHSNSGFNINNGAATTAIRDVSDLGLVAEQMSTCWFS